MKDDVPFLRDSQIEQEAELLLAEYARDQQPIVVPPVPIDEIIEVHLKLEFEIRALRTLFGFGDIHGAIWFSERLVAVDEQLDPDKYPNKRGRYHFTLAHEVGHWRLHRKHFLKTEEQGNLFDGVEAKPDYVCRSTERKKRVELQADGFAANLLMPRRLVRQEWVKWHGSHDPIILTELPDHQERLRAELMRRGGGKPDGGWEGDMVLESVIRPFAELFQVSAEAMRIRLEDLEFLLREKEALLF